MIMSEPDPFITAACRQGFSAEAATAALATLRLRLAEHGLAERLYAYRTAERGPGGAQAGGEATRRPRLLLAFQSADAALSFAQHHGLGRSPRLIALSLPQALTVLLQRSNISALLIADEPAEALPSGLPPGLRVARDTLLDLLNGVG